MENFQAMIEAMREEHRLKLNIDYSYTFKFGVLRIFCDDVYKASIIEYAVRFGVTVQSYHTYERQVS